MMIRELWLAKAIVDLTLYAAHGIQKLVRGSPKPEPEPELDEQSQPLSHALVDHNEAMITRGARAFPPKPETPEPAPTIDPLERLKG